jgi:chromate transporter
LFFAYHVFWPNGFPPGLDWSDAYATIGALTAEFDGLAASLAAAAFIALLRFKVGIVPVIGASAALGLAWTLVIPGSPA